MNVNKASQRPSYQCLLVRMLSVPMSIKRRHLTTKTPPATTSTFNAVHRLCGRRSIAICSALALATIALFGCERYGLDKKMQELCEKDGGVNVFQKVVLPSKAFGADGIPFSRYWLDSTLIGTTNRLGPNYRYVVSERVLKAGDPMKGQGQLVRRTERIYRVEDQTLLGESVWYGRAGGDLIVLEHFSTAGCPSPVESLLTAVFVKENEQ